MGVTDNLVVRPGNVPIFVSSLCVMVLVATSVTVMTVMMVVVVLVNVIVTMATMLHANDVGSHANLRSLTVAVMKFELSLSLLPLIIGGCRGRVYFSGRKYD